MKSCSHWGKDMFASIKSVTSQNFLSSLKDCFAMFYLMVYRQKQLCKYLFSQLLQFFMLQLFATGSHFNNVFCKIIYLYQHGIFGYAEWKTVWKLFVIPNFCNQHIFAVVQLEELRQVALFKKSVITDIKSSLLWYPLLSSSRLRKILSRKMIQLRNLCSPSSPMSPWSWRSPWSTMCLQWQQRFSHYWKKRERDTLP